jgi:hypothetical protein
VAGTASAIGKFPVQRALGIGAPLAAPQVGWAEAQSEPAANGALLAWDHSAEA